MNHHRDRHSIADLWEHDEEMAQARRNASKLFGIALLILSNLFSLANVLAMF